jgi:hypothetical protein
VVNWSQQVKGTHGGRRRMATARTVKIPESVLASAQTLDDLDDWLSAHNPELVGQLRQIRRREDLGEQGKDLRELLKRWPTK